MNTALQDHKAILDIEKIFNVKVILAANVSDTARGISAMPQTKIRFVYLNPVNRYYAPKKTDQDKTLEMRDFNGKIEIRKGLELRGEEVTRFLRKVGKSNPERLEVLQTEDVRLSNQLGDRIRCLRLYPHNTRPSQKFYLAKVEEMGRSINPFLQQTSATEWLTFFAPVLALEWTYRNRVPPFHILELIENIDLPEGAKRELRAIQSMVTEGNGQRSVDAKKSADQLCAWFFNEQGPPPSSIYTPDDAQDYSLRHSEIASIAALLPAYNEQ